MKNGTAGVASELLSPPYLERFSTLFGVAARKSLVQWRSVGASEAQLTLIDESSNPRELSASSLCVISVGGNYAGKAANARWVSHLPSEYTVSDLIDALDRAAVYLMDWSARQKVASKVSTASALEAFSGEAPQPAVHVASSAMDAQYQLTSWVSPEAPFNTGACIRAMALMSRQPISLGQLCGHSGLDVDTAKLLIASLGRRGVLRSSGVTCSAAKVTSAPHSGRKVQGGFLQRLTRWVRGSNV